MNNATVAMMAAAGMAGLVWYSRRPRPVDDYSFEDRVVVVTGGSRGLGLELSRRLAGEGARLAILARDGEELNGAREELLLSTEVLAVPCDLREQDQVEAAIALVADHFEGIDVLINNAGVIQVGPIEHMTLADFEESLAVHLWGPLYAINAALPHLRRAGQARIVNISSIGGRVAFPHLAPYAVGKFALGGLSAALRSELARHDIRVTTVFPGLMRTGSPPNASFKGKFRKEYAWFSIFDSLPIVSMDAGDAAEEILEACRKGLPRLALSFKTKLAFAVEALFPEVTDDLLALAGRLLPAPDPDRGTESRLGWESQSAASPSILTRLGDRATAENNETVGMPDSTRGDGTAPGLAFS